MSTSPPRTGPGSPWLHSSAPAPARQPEAAAAPARGALPGRNATAGRPPLAAPVAPPPLAGVEVNEFHSDTLFDRFFGPELPGSPGRR